MKIDELQNGIVFDHVKSGNGMKIYELLRLGNFDGQIALIQNAKSSKMGKKDVLKISCKNFDFDLDAVAFIDDALTVNIIKDGELVEKKQLSLPDKITNVVKCKNPRCITSTEQEINHVFKLTDKDNGVYRCIYCETQAK